MNKEKIYRYTE